MTIDQKLVKAIKNFEEIYKQYLNSDGTLTPI